MTNTTISDENFPLGLVDLTNDEYHTAPGISSSHLNTVHGRSLKHYWQKYLNPDREPEKKTPALQLGTAIHTAILEPHMLEQRVIIGLDVERRSNADKLAWADFEEEHKGKIILKRAEHAHVIGIRDAFHAHPVAPGLLTFGRAEQSIFARESDVETIDNDTGEITGGPGPLIKCQPDFMRDEGDYIVDVKSTQDASPEGFAKSVLNYRYLVQAAWYFRVMDAAFGGHHERWVWIAFEPEPPYAIGIYWAEPEDLARAAISADRDYQRILEGKRLSQYPDYGATPQALVLPAWGRV